MHFFINLHVTNFSQTHVLDTPWNESRDRPNVSQNLVKASPNRIEGSIPEVRLRKSFKREKRRRIKNLVEYSLSKLCGSCQSEEPFLK